MGNFASIYGVCLNLIGAKTVNESPAEIKGPFLLDSNLLKCLSKHLQDLARWYYISFRRVNEKTESRGEAKIFFKGKVTLCRSQLLGIASRLSCRVSRHVLLKFTFYWTSIKWFVALRLLARIWAFSPPQGLYIGEFQHKSSHQGSGGHGHSKSPLTTPLRSYN